MGASQHHTYFQIRRRKSDNVFYILFVNSNKTRTGFWNNKKEEKKSHPMTHTIWPQNTTLSMMCYVCLHDKNRKENHNYFWENSCFWESSRGKRERLPRLERLEANWVHYFVAQDFFLSPILGSGFWLLHPPSLTTRASGGASQRCEQMRQSLQYNSFTPNSLSSFTLSLNLE